MKQNAKKWFFQFQHAVIVACLFAGAESRRTFGQGNVIIFPPGPICTQWPCPDPPWPFPWPRPPRPCPFPDDPWICEILFASVVEGEDVGWIDADPLIDCVEGCTGDSACVRECTHRFGESVQTMRETIFLNGFDGDFGPWLPLPSIDTPNGRLYCALHVPSRRIVCVPILVIVSGNSSVDAFSELSTSGSRDAGDGQNSKNLEKLISEELVITPHTADRRTSYTVVTYGNEELAVDYGRIAEVASDGFTLERPNGTIRPITDDDGESLLFAGDPTITTGCGNGLCAIAIFLDDDDQTAIWIICDANWQDCRVTFTHWY